MIDTNEIRSRVNIYEWTDEEVISLCDEIDRLRGEQQTPPQFQGKTVEVRVPVVVDKNGDWMASDVVANGEARYWLTATLPVPAEVCVEAAVHTATNNETATSGGRG